jgi:hypothetical protein
MRIIELTKIVSARWGDNDGDEAPGPEITVPVSINVDTIRTFYPRRDDRPGCRITFTGGDRGFAVTETHHEVMQIMNLSAAGVVD